MGITVKSADVELCTYQKILSNEEYFNLQLAIRRNAAYAEKILKRSGIEAFRASYFRAVDAVSSDLSKQISPERRESISEFCRSMHAIFKAVEALTGELEEDLPYKLDTSHRRFTWPK